MRRIATLVMVVSSVLIATTAAAQSPLRLAVADCGGAQEATWACDGNTGAAVTLVASVVVPADLSIAELTGQTARIHFDFLQPVPAWWQVGTGQCRPVSSFQVDLAATSATCATKMSDGGNLIGTRIYTVGPDAVSDPGDVLGVRRARLDVVSAFQAQVPPAPWAPHPGDEVALFTLSIGRQNTTGVDACGGCSDCVLMTLWRVALVQPVGVGDVYLSSNGSMESMVTGQAHWYECIVPADRSSWGQVKALYR